MGKSRRLTFDNLPELPFEEWSAEGYARQLERNRSDSHELSSGDEPEDNRLFYLSMGSGSSGNCCYVGTKEGGVLIDAGVNASEVATMLKANGIAIRNVKGILLTHDHSDHVKFVYPLLREHKHLKLLCSNRVLTGLLRRHNVSKRIKEYHVPIFKEIPFRVLDLEITAFDVPHDGTDNMGFFIEAKNQKFALATDLGAVTDRARHYMSRANYLVIEANYDRVMLRDGRYPEYLKARIMTDHGHMDNEDTGQFLSGLPGGIVRYVFLCHLSADNNTPEKALTATRAALESTGKSVGEGLERFSDLAADIQLVALPRFGASRLYVFRP